MKWFLFLFAFAPQIVFGQEGGLVTCGGVAKEGAEGINAVECNFCTFIAMFNGIITWLFSVLAILAIFMLVVAGFRLVTSGGNPDAMSSAKKMLTSVVVGFVIVLSAWLIVDTVMKTLVKDDADSDIEIKFGIWNTIDAGKCGGLGEKIDDSDVQRGRGGGGGVR